MAEKTNPQMGPRTIAHNKTCAAIGKLDKMFNSSWGNMRTRYDKLTDGFWEEFWAEVDGEKTHRKT